MQLEKFPAPTYSKESESEQVLQTLYDNLRKNLSIVSFRKSDSDEVIDSEYKKIIKFFYQTQLASLDHISCLQDEPSTAEKQLDFLSDLCSEVTQFLEMEVQLRALEQEISEIQICSESVNLEDLETLQIGLDEFEEEYLKTQKYFEKNKTNLSACLSLSIQSMMMYSRISILRKVFERPVASNLN